MAKVSVTQEGGKIKIEASGTIDAVEISAPVIVDLAVDGKIGEVNVKSGCSTFCRRKNHNCSTN